MSSSTATTTVPAILNTTTLVGAIFVGVVVIILAWIVGSVLNLLIHRALDRTEASGGDSTSIRFLGQLGRLDSAKIALE